MKNCKLYICLLVLLAVCGAANAQTFTEKALKNFNQPPASAKPWVFWYWMQAAVSREGIRADLEAMKRVGVEGAFLMPIKDTAAPPLIDPPVRQLSPEWWRLVKFAMEEAKRLNLQLAMHISDGFALAGGPWITPELSMQKLVWSRSYFVGGAAIHQQLQQPETVQGYYQDVATYAYPAPDCQAFSMQLVPSVSTSNGVNASFLATREGKGKNFKSDSACWIQYHYPAPFNCRAVTIRTGGNSYQAQRLKIFVSDDGIHFREHTQLVAPRHGWQDVDEDVTHSIAPVTASYFRFVYDKAGSEPGAEDLDAAKWKPTLKVAGIYLSDEPVINQYEGKNGSMWRVGEPGNELEVPTADAVPLQRIINLSSKVDVNGWLTWSAPPGNWIVVRIGHTSTGHTNATGGAARGLECDKFNPAAIRLQFNNWFAKAFSQTDPKLAAEVLKIMHVDSWEAGSQNWSITFPGEFKKRRGYDCKPYLLAMTGVPIGSINTSEKFLHDVRQTLAELVDAVFYKTLHQLAAARGCRLSAESVAPTMVSDGLLHYQDADIAMGEFWLNSPTHDKPNDMADAISGAHIYGKKNIWAESFTTVRMDWNEYPGMLKTTGDRNFARGINKMVLHVFVQNPWLNRQPGMTLDGVGLYFQRDQTWFEQSKAWISYLSRTQWMLQQGDPVTDIAVFTGEEVPRRAILPDRLVETLPGLFGPEKLKAEEIRRANVGEPLRTKPAGVTHSANMADPELYIDPLNGYHYDSFNPDALLRSRFINGAVQLPVGGRYRVLIIPGRHPMQPNASVMSIAVARKLLQLANAGAIIYMDTSFSRGIGLGDNDKAVKKILRELYRKTMRLPFLFPSLKQMGVQRDLEMLHNNHQVAWTHRSMHDADIYFISNQSATELKDTMLFRTRRGYATLFDAVSGAAYPVNAIRNHERMQLSITLPANGSAILVFEDRHIPGFVDAAAYFHTDRAKPLLNWTLQFDTLRGGPRQPLHLDSLVSWTALADTMLHYYSGTATYTTTFNNPGVGSNSLLIRFDSIQNIATVIVNGVDCGTLWTYPYQLKISGDILKPFNNTISVMVTNTWANRLIGDQRKPEKDRITWTTAPFRAGNQVHPAGLIGNVVLYYPYPR